MATSLFSSNRTNRFPVFGFHLAYPIAGSRVITSIIPPDLVSSSYSTILTNFARWRFRLLFWAATFLVFCYPIVVIVLSTAISIHIRTPLLGQVYPSIQSPPVPCGTGSVYHQPVLHRYYGFIRPLLTHWSGFPIQVIPRLTLPLQLSSLTQKQVGC